LTQPFGEGVNGLASKKKQDLDKKIYPSSYPCAGIMAATFSDKIAEEIGDMMGEEALWAGYSGLYGFTYGAKVGIGLHYTELSLLASNCKPLGWYIGVSFRVHLAHVTLH
jgi:hypothetical protein